MSAANRARRRDYRQSNAGNCAPLRHGGGKNSHNPTTSERDSTMYEKVTGVYLDSLVWREKPEPERPDPKLDRITLSAYLKQTGWTVELLDYAIASFNHPKPVGRTTRALSKSIGEPIYSKSAIAVWRARMTTDLQRFGFLE
jgi:hypothetical protein